MSLYDIHKFRTTGYASDMPTAWIGRAIGGTETANFITADGYFVRGADGKLFNAYRNAVYLESKSGTLSCSVSGLILPEWEYNGQKIEGDSASFTVLNNGDKVKLSWSSAEEVVDFHGGSNLCCGLAELGSFVTGSLRISDARYITGDLSDLQGKITKDLWLSQAVNVTGNLADLGGKITGYLYLHTCAKVSGVYQFENTPPKHTNLYGTSCSADDNDKMLNNYAASGMENGYFAITKGRRTSASDAAVATLKELGWQLVNM
jgi:hypothetical protein